MRNEPAWTVGAITALVAAVITVAAAFGLPLTPDQEQAVLGLVAIVGPLVAAYFTRKRVVPVQNR